MSKSNGAEDQELRNRNEESQVMPHSQNYPPPGFINQKPTAWKRITHSSDPEQKQAIFRVHGICPELPEQNVDKVSDPRRPDPCKVEMINGIDFPVPYLKLGYDLLKIVLTRTDLIKLEAKCNNFEHYATILQDCFASVLVKGVIMISPIFWVSDKMRITDEVQFGKRLWLWELGCFEFDQILDNLPGAANLASFMAKSGQLRVPTKAEIAEKWQQLVPLLGEDWQRKRLFDGLQSHPTTTSNAPIQEPSTAEGCSSSSGNVPKETTSLDTIKQEILAEMAQEVKQEILEPSEIDHLIRQEHQQVSTSTSKKTTKNAPPAKKGPKSAAERAEDREIRAIVKRRKNTSSSRPRSPIDPDTLPIPPGYYANVLANIVQQQPLSPKRAAKRKKR